MTDIVERLREQYEAWPKTTQLWVESAADEITRLRSLNKELAEALDPFAVFADPLIWEGTVYEGRDEDTSVLYSHKQDKSISIGDFLNARAALTKYRGKE